MKLMKGHDLLQKLNKDEKRHWKPNEKAKIIGKLYIGNHQSTPKGKRNQQSA